ncbi:MAG: hypothetical protein KGM15_07665 [Pseudomonadota bacterium]|nr:hypothetical protein [Pseudomonadota bacterium]
MTLSAILVLFGGASGWAFATVFAFFAAVPALFAFVAYFVLLWRRPEMLESEEYRLKRHAQLTSYERGASTEILDARDEALRLQAGKVGLGEEEPE